jgi:hypothetical protein
MTRAAVVACISLALWAPTLHAQTGLSQAEATQLFGAAGFPIKGGEPVNRCGKPANPRVTFVDVNGDKRPEALFVDEGPCYAPAGRYFAVLAKEGSTWRPLISGNGTIQALANKTDGWLDMRVAEPGCTRSYRFQADRYVPSTDCTGRPLAGAAPKPPAAAGASPTKLSPADEAAAFKAAGFKQRGKQWRSDCDDPGTPSYTPGAIDRVIDLNGDGRPEALITEGGTHCYGNTGQGYFVVTRLADGGWKRVTSGTGIAEFLKTKGADGWPDLVVGGPGFCFPVQRWDGREYKLQRWEYQGKACKPQR